MWIAPGSRASKGRRFRIVGSSFVAAGALLLTVLVGVVPAAAATNTSTTLKDKIHQACACEYGGASVDVSGSTAIVGVPGIDDGAGRAYVYTDTKGTWKKTAELQGVDASPGDWFGDSVAISGTTIAVGAQGHAGFAGRAYVFAESGTTWSEVAELQGSDTQSGDWFGSSVAIDGATVVVGAPGAASNAGNAYVFSQTGGAWSQAAELSGAGSPGVFGYSVGLSGSTAIVGAPGSPTLTGNAYVYSDTGGSWQKVATLSGTGAGQHDFGSSVAIDGAEAIVGGWTAGAGKGTAFVFAESGGVWSQAAQLSAADNASGFGAAVTISGTTAAVSAVGSSGNGGRAYVYVNSGSGWAFTSELAPSGNEGGDFFGNRSLALSGASTLIVGAPAHGGPGSAFIFTDGSGTWSQVANLKSADSNAGDLTGTSVALSSFGLVAGAPGHDGTGRAYLYPTPPPWHPVIGLEGSDSAAGDQLGTSVAISGTEIVVGAPGSHGGGSAYVFNQTVGVPYTPAAVRSGASAYFYEQGVELNGTDTAGGDDFGASVAVSGNTAVIGAPGHDGTGAVYVFSRRSGTWVQVAELEGSDTMTGDQLGLSVGIASTGTIIAGAPGHGGTGSAYVFTETAGTWSQVELEGSDTSSGDNFGTSVSIADLALVVGAPNHAGTGSAYVFSLNSSTGAWSQAAEIVGSGTESGDDFGSSVAVGHQMAVVGAPGHGGSAYVFKQTSKTWAQTTELLGPHTGAAFGASVAISNTTVAVGASGDKGTGSANVFNL